MKTETDCNGAGETKGKEGEYIYTDEGDWEDEE